MTESLSIDVHQPLVIKGDDLTLLTNQAGNLEDQIAGFGLFFKDTCYLSKYVLQLQGAVPFVLGASDEPGFSARITLSNHAFDDAGGAHVEAHKILLERSIILDERDGVMVDTLDLTSFANRDVSLSLTLDIDTRFQDIMAMRGAKDVVRGELLPPAWDGDALRLVYRGADGLRRALTLRFSHSADVIFGEGQACRIDIPLSLRPRAPATLVVAIRIEEQALADQAAPPPDLDADAYLRAARETLDRSAGAFARVSSDNPALDRVMTRSLADAALLTMIRGEERFTAAGAPWYIGLFGRDGLIPSIQGLAYNPDLCAGNVDALAARQGERDVERTSEEPGKILHELRVGELAHLGKTNQTPSYSSVDSTPLFLIALARHARWTGDFERFRRLRGHVDRALAWLDRREARSEQGLIEYWGRTADGGPSNQAWRDSGKGVLRADGTCPDPPLALVEVQGVAYLARREVAAVLAALGEDAAAQGLERQASDLAERFERAFWMEDQGCYCLAIESGGRQVASIASNAGNVLWTGIARPDRAHRVAERLMRPDMFSGWGVRTLSLDHPAHDPLAYQQGSVWPFDNSLIVSGFLRYGEVEAAQRIIAGSVDAARAFSGQRLPEFITGVSRERGLTPIRSPRADPMQAWSAWSVPFMLIEMLGVRVDGASGCVTVRRPTLPSGVQRLTLEDLKTPAGPLTLAFERAGADTLVTAKDGRQILRTDEPADPRAL